jgi:hypothetical protein
VTEFFEKIWERIEAFGIVLTFYKAQSTVHNTGDFGLTASVFLLLFDVRCGSGSAFSRKPCFRYAPLSQ